MTTTPKRITRRHALSAAAGLGAGTLLGIPLGTTFTTTEEPFGETDGATGRYDDATRDDHEFNRLFEHRFDEVQGVSMHSVTGGQGPGMVLLHCSTSFAAQSRFQKPGTGSQRRMPTP
ncbi:hypothetical protein [Glycomyces sp. MUSA5-2]|uniref:hypothetical protein n=1 Tax=Glycomyces sp. MUSA5-2 TaxID=2053002 RepID=UPI00300B5BF5